jgi:UDP-glucose 4-epimerase
VKRVQITGGKGYIGGNLEILLKERGYDVVITDKGEPIQSVGVDGIVHLAALSGIKACKSDFRTAVWDNIFSAFHSFDISREFHIPVVFTSSQAAKNPLQNLYATIKSIIEIRASQVTQTGGDIRVLRLSNVYGGKGYFEKKNTVVKQMLNQKFSGSPIRVHGDGKQERDFIHVEDVCEYIVRALEHSNKIYKPIDIGTGKGTTILRLAQMMRHSFAFTDARDVGVESSIADPTDAIALFDYKAYDRVQEYIDEIIDLHSNRPVVSYR